MSYRECLKLAFFAIRANKLRSFLTMLGIIIGISSVITIGAIGTSMQGAITDIYQAGGMNYAYIYPNWEVAEELYQEDMFTADDIEAMQARFGDELLYSAPYETVNGKAKKGNCSADIYIQASAKDYHLFNKMIEMTEGRYLKQSDIDSQKKVLVIPVEMAKKLYGNSSAIGKEVTVNIGEESDDYKVIGVYEAKSTVLDRFDASTSFECFAPYTTVMGYDFYSYYFECYVDSDDIDSLLSTMSEYLAKIKDKQKEFYTFESAQSEMGMLTDILDIVSLAIGAIAAISLIVGGIGIMNIMLVSVTERTREIGIRKALGAKTKEVLRQFLIESMILSVTGGVIGLVLGMSVAGIAAFIFDAELIVDPVSVLTAVGFSALVGIAFGYFPAKKAAEMNPIDALRYE